ncbi:MFS general substrate transporter [Bimuria novae-zelandiae CBS 107.79]|uniref:MFS general substrate transporter n=1 Tax=Bimuria novae-zelandiae CBS 107.79 TaxID=1447943 RepID=A0A6A5USW0_9PLEO|nr:MFS general substrate transporter [Bimuria novae-zelandiae CBS 107.79]
MSASNDAAILEEEEIAREFRARLRARQEAARANKTHRIREQPGKMNGNTRTEELGEDAPLLSCDREGSTDNGDEDGETEWFGYTELQGLPWWKKPSIYWLLPPFMLFTMAFGAIIVPKLNLIMDLVCDQYYASSPDPISGPMDPGSDRCRTDAVSSRSSLFLLYGNLCSGILAAITSPKLGALSDRYGRKKLLVFTTLGALLGEALTILAAKYPETVHVNWILVGYALDGLSGSFIVGMALAHSYATDCTSPQRRNVAFGYFHACLFTGVAVGPVLSGYVISWREKSVGKTEAVLLIFYIALACHAFFIFFLAFVVPESLSKDRQDAARRRHQEEKRRNGGDPDFIDQLRSINILAPLEIFWPTGPGTSPALRRNLVLLAATDTVMFGVAMGAMGIVVVYTRRQFGWEELESGRFVSIVNACRVLTLLVALPLITRLVRGKDGARKQRNSGSDVFDLSLIRLAVLFDMLGYLGYALAREGNLFILSGAVAALGGIGSPGIGSALTKHVPPDRIGQLLGATGLLHAFARVMGPTIFNGIYSATVGSFRQTVFVCLTATFGVALVLSLFVRPHVYLDLAPDGGPSRRGNATDGPEEEESA